MKVSLLHDNIFVDDSGRFYEGERLYDGFGRSHPHLDTTKTKPIPKDELLEKRGWKDISKIGGSNNYRILPTGG
jgi:hypothetical protein